MLPKTLFVALVALGSSACVVETVAPVEGHFDRTLAVNGPVDLDIRTGSGGIRMSVLAYPGFEVDASTGSGGISSDQPDAETGERSRRHLHGTVRGGGPLVELSTGSGGIHIE